MNKHYSTFYSAIAIITILFCVFYFMMPQNYDKIQAPLSKFSTKRALEKVKTISSSPHYIGSENHKKVAQYIIDELHYLGLETSIQEGFTLTEWGNLTKSKNILAKIKGTDNSKALLLLSHYDSAPHSFSYGASDDATGVATILESIRAFLHNKSPQKNDIIILFTDAEELGLNGAALFVTQHHWAKEVGLVLNFEARGTTGPSYMFMETNHGNSKMVEGFAKANPNFPVSNSLMYSIYKMLPNDTDLTVFREKGRIQGFNFAFIDNHFNYHTVQDNYDNLNPKTLAHQGTYLVPTLQYFSNADLSDLNSSEDNIYFSFPYNFISYPFSWIYPLLIIAFALFVLFVFIGLGKRIIDPTEVIKGFKPLFGSLLVAGLLTYLGWRLILLIYPQYNDILQGFTYNGHYYITAFICFSLSICFMFYRNKIGKNIEMNQMIAPLSLWFVINLIIAIMLKGAGFLIIPIFSSVLMLGYFVITQKQNWLFNITFSVPILVILAPFIQMFPIGLGLKILFGSAVLTVLTFTLLLPLLGKFTFKRIWALFFLLLAIGMFIMAHQNSHYEKGKAKPNSLLYVINADKNKAYWATYDKHLDSWTKSLLGKNPKLATELNNISLFSKYGSMFTYMAEAPIKNFEKPTIKFKQDTIRGNQHFYKIVITPNRNVNRYDIFANENMSFYNLKANGVKSLEQKNVVYPRKGKKLLSYYVVDNIPLELDFSIPKNQKMDMQLLESSFDLLNNKHIKVPQRKDWMMPTPFVLTDAVTIYQKIKPTPVSIENKSLITNPKYISNRKVLTDSIPKLNDAN